MSDWTKADGAKIQITFDNPLVGSLSGNESHFTVTVPEYDYVPNGTLSNVQKTVDSTYRTSYMNQYIDLSDGTISNLDAITNKLTLEVDDG